MSFIEWLINKLRGTGETNESEWGPIPLRIEDQYPEPPESENTQENEEDKGTVIVIDI